MTNMEKAVGPALRFPRFDGLPRPEQGTSDETAVGKPEAVVEAPARQFMSFLFAREMGLTERKYELFDRVGDPCFRSIRLLVREPEQKAQVNNT